MRRATRNNSSGPLQSLPYGPRRKRKAPPVTEEERVLVVEEEGAATGYRGLVNHQDSESSSALPSRPRKHVRATAPEARGDDVAEAAEPATKLGKTRLPPASPRPRRSPQKSLPPDNVADGARKAAGKPRPSARNNRNRSSLATMGARQKGLAEETERRIEEGIPSEDEEGGGARLSASHDPLQLQEKQPANGRTTVLSLGKRISSSSEDEDGDLLPAGRSRESPEKVVEELMNNVVTGTVARADGVEEQEVEDLEFEGIDGELNPSDREDVDEAIRKQLSTEANGGANGEVEVRPESLASEEDDVRCEMSLVTAFGTKLEGSHEALQMFKEQLEATADTANNLMELRTGTDSRSGYTQILQEIIRRLAEEEHPDNGVLEALADFSLNIISIVSGIRDAHRDVKALLENLNAGIISGTKSAQIIETMLEQKGFKRGTPHDGINWKRINRNLVARENEVLVSAEPKHAEPQTPRRSARSNPSRYRSQGALPTPEARPPPPPPAASSPHDSLSDMESLGSAAPVIGDDAPVEIVRIESFGSRPSNTPRRSKRRHESEDDDSPQVREDRAWSSPELKALFRRLAQVQKAEPGKIIVLDSRSGYTRTKEEILTKAKEIKDDMMRSGRAGSLKPTWDDI
ncbi:hypothetical protein HOY80DRAFT_961748 [Tuber brumale]|nr:hypothetical protein HOY80DRAFT_961748 [Tuber brumale]